MPRSIASQHRLWLLGIHTSVLIVILALSGPSAATTDTDSERITKLKAAFVYNFVKFVEWPSDTFPEEESPIVIGVSGDDETFYLMLRQTVARKRIRGRSLKVVRLSIPTLDARDEEQRAEAIRDFGQRIGACHLAYFAPDEHAAVTDILEQAIVPGHVLTVGDGQAYVESPTMLDLVMSDGRITFYADRECIESSQLRLSSKLLRLARQND